MTRGNAMAFALLLVVLIWPAILGATITYAFLRGMSAEAFAGIMAALATVTLAYITWRSVAQTGQVATDEAASRRVNTTVGLMNQYVSTPIPITSDIALPAQAASSQIMLFSGKLDEARGLKTQYGTGNAAADEQYRALTSSFAIVLNFYLIATQLLRRHLLDEALFMNTFAKTFLATFDAMLKVNAVIGAVPVERIEERRDFEAACNRWLAQAEQNRTQGDQPRTTV